MLVSKTVRAEPHGLTRSELRRVEDLQAWDRAQEGLQEAEGAD